MNYRKHILENKVNYILARPSNGRTQFLKLIMDQYNEGIIVNLKKENLLNDNENIEVINDPINLNDLDLKDHKVLFLNNATIIGFYNEGSVNVYKLLRKINKEKNITVICVGSYITFLEYKESLLANADRVIKLHREYYYSKKEEDRLKISMEIHDNMDNYDEFYEDEITFEDLTEK